MAGAVLRSGVGDGETSSCLWNGHMHHTTTSTGVARAVGDGGGGDADVEWNEVR